MSLAALAIPLLLSPPQSIPEESTDDGTGWRLERIDLEIMLLPEEGKMEMVGTMKLVLEVERSRGPTISMEGNGSAQRFVSVDAPTGAEVDLNIPHPRRSTVRVTNVRFTELLEKGAEVELLFETSSVGRASQFLIDERIAIASWTDGWHPFPIPDPGTGESLSGKMRAVGTTTFHLPPGWRGACNGVRVEREESADATREVWELEQPLARSFAAGPFHQYTEQAGERTVTVSRLSESESEPDMHALAAAAALEAMEAKLGPYPYDDFYIVEVPADLVTWTGASQQGMIFAVSSAFGYEDGNLALFAHEMGHGWWGNLVAADGPGALVCGEALAQYGCVIALEASEGDEATADFLRFSRSGYSQVQCAKGFFQMWAAGNVRPLAELDNSTAFDHNLSDAKGHWVYHMLRRRVGDEIFFGVLRGLIRDHANRGMTLDDVRAAFEAAAPEAELETFFEQWLERTGAPILEAEWEAAGAGEIELVITQAQSEDPYHLFLDVKLVTAETSELHQVELHARETRVVVPSNPRRGEVIDVVLDPRHRLLIWKREYGERPE